MALAPTMGDVNVDEPEPEVHDATAHEEMPPAQPPSPVLHPKPARKPNAPADVPVTRPSQVDRPAQAGSGFPWWLVIVILVMSEGKKRK